MLFLTPLKNTCHACTELETNMQNGILKSKVLRLYGLICCTGLIITNKDISSLAVFWHFHKDLISDAGVCIIFHYQNKTKTDH